MTTPKRRKPLEDSLANEFVYGSPAPQPPVKAVTPEPVTASPEKPARKAATKNTPRPTEDDILSRVLTPTEDRERMIRFTADLPESLHYKLTMLAAKSGKKKVEIVRAILEEVLKDVDE